PRQRRRHVVLVRAQRVLRVLSRDAGGGGPTPDPVQGTRLERSGSRGRKSSERGFSPRGSGYIPSTDSGRGLPDRSSGYTYIGGKLIRKIGIGAFAALALTGCSMAQDAGEVDAPHEETTVNIPTPSPTEGSESPKPKAPVETETAKPKAPKLSDFDGMAGNDGVFDIHVNEAYVDEDNILSDGLGYYHTGQPGQEYVIFNIQITNSADIPMAWYGYENVAYDDRGRMFYNDNEAEFAVADDYYSGEELNPGTSVETDVIFAVPEGTKIASVGLTSDASYGNMV